MSDSDSDKRKKRKKKLKKNGKEKHKSHKKKSKKRKHSTESSDSEDDKKSKKLKRKNNKHAKNKNAKEDDNNLSASNAAARSFRPMTKEEWEKKQSVVRRVYDESTGRSRLVKGDGEILEEIVSRDQHLKINRQATRGDGEFFMKQVGLKNDE